uniref:Uncharacterized protein n=1 Tax=Arundo donax TaxID=35708 RepID=A0A0A8Y0Z5_ARUDO
MLCVSSHACKNRMSLPGTLSCQCTRIYLAAVAYLSVFCP